MENYIIEKIAADMLEKNVELKKEFEEAERRSLCQMPERLQFFMNGHVLYELKIGIYP